VEETGASAVADTPVDVGTPSDVGGADDSSLSADALIDKYATKSEETPGQAEPSKGTTVDAKPQSGQEAKPAEGQQEEEFEEPLFAEPEPENVKKAFKSLQKWHPDVARQFRKDYYENKQYREVYTLPEAKEMREVFQSVQDAREAKAAQADLLAVDDLLNSSPGQLLQHIYQRNPNSAVGLTLEGQKALYDYNPQLYRSQVSEPAVRNYHNFFAAKAKEVGNQDVLTAIEILNEFERQTIGQTPAAQQPQYQVDPRMQQRLQQLEGERAQAINGSINTFKSTIDGDFDSAISGEVGKLIDRAGGDLSDAARQEITERVMADVKDKLLSDDVLQRRLAWEVSRGQRDGRHREALSNMIVANAKRFIPAAASQHLTWMTKEILRANATATEKAARVAPTRNVSGGKPGSSPPERLSKEEIDKLTPDEILDAAAAGKI
jgi:hypothetical protein